MKYEDLHRSLGDGARAVATKMDLVALADAVSGLEVRGQ